jgi:hypothetical protein
VHRLSERAEDNISPFAETSESELPIPARNFASLRRIMIAVLVVSVLLPLGCLVAYGAYDYQRRIQEAGDVIDRLARVAEEEAVKVFDLNREIESRIVEYLGNDDEKTIRSHGLELHRKLRAIGGSFPQVAAIAIYSESGELLVTSRFYPAPTVSAKEREDFQAAAKSSIGPYFSMPTHSQFTGLDIFHTTLSRRDAKGRFLGVVAIALRRASFLNFASPGPLPERRKDTRAISFRTSRVRGGIQHALRQRAAIRSLPGPHAHGLNHRRCPQVCIVSPRRKLPALCFRRRLVDRRAQPMVSAYRPYQRPHLDPLRRGLDPDRIFACSAPGAAAQLGTLAH